MAAKPLRPLRFEGNLAYVPLSQGLEAVVDASDAWLVDDRLWYADIGGETFYAVSNAVKPNGRKGLIFLHRVLFSGLTSQHEIDHIDGNGLNNTRANLRRATHAENSRNRRISRNNKSGFKGVWPKGKKWGALIEVNGRKHHLGTYPTPEEAHAAYCEAASRLHGQFARAA
jgi:hypothetical protein